MRFVTFQREGYVEAGVLTDDGIVGLRGAGFESVVDVIRGGADAQDRVQRWIGRMPGAELVNLAGAALLSPIPRPPKIICIGLNYRDHAEESNMAIPQTPTVFCKFPTAVIGPGDPIVLPKNSTQARLRGRICRGDRQGRPPHRRGRTGANTSSGTPSSTT